MTDSDLKMLATFRQGLPAPDEGAARRVYARATAPRTPRFPTLALMRGTRGRRRLTLALGVAALVIVPSAVAFAGRIVNLFEGTSPTPAVTASYAPLAAAPTPATRQKIADDLPQADVSRVHGVLEIQTAEGPEDLWTAPNFAGGQCVFVDFANDAPEQGVQPGNGTCDIATPPDSKMTLQSFWMLSHRSVSTVYGRVYVNAASVKLSLADGSSQKVPVVEGNYLASIAKNGGVNGNSVVNRATAYDAQGDEVAEWAPPN
jgi:hypothetical protein